MANAPINGRCECGRVQYRFEATVNDYSHCHCSQCRRLHGAAFASFAGIDRAALEVLAGADQIKRYDSSPGHTRMFCQHCGSSLAVELNDEPDQVYVAMGTMNDAPELPPGYHIFVTSRAPWHEITDDLPQWETHPPD